MKYKNLIPYKRILAVTAVVLVSLFILSNAAVKAATAPYGCKGAPSGPPAAGTVCPDGSIPATDTTLPAGCPGGPFGPAAANTVCPARPGRSQCTMNGSQCITTDGRDVSKGDTLAGNSPGTTFQPAAISCTAQNLNKSNCGIIGYLVVTINVLAGLVGIVVVAVIIIAGIQYSTAANDPQKLAAARGRIVNALLALAVFIFMYAFLQWVVPGGIF